MPVGTIPPLLPIMTSNAMFAQSRVQQRAVNPVGDATALGEQAQQPLLLPVRHPRQSARRQAQDAVTQDDTPTTAVGFARAAAAQQAIPTLPPHSPASVLAAQAYQTVLKNLSDAATRVSLRA